MHFSNAFISFTGFQLWGSFVDVLFQFCVHADSVLVPIQAAETQMHTKLLIDIQNSVLHQSLTVVLVNTQLFVFMCATEPNPEMTSTLWIDRKAPFVLTLRNIL